jgi:hypothetical protein
MMKSLIALLLTLSSFSATADVLFRQGCGGEPFSHIKWEVYVPEGYTDRQLWADRSLWTVAKTPNHPDCTYFDAVTVTGEADRIRPALVDIDTNATEFTVEIDRGRVEREGTTLYVYGDGDVSDAELLIDGEQYWIPFREEPRCDISGGYDCMGYRQNGSYDLIYYGDEDTTIVNVEVLISIYEDTDEPYQIGGGSRYDSALLRVQKWNTALERDRIYVRFVLKEVWVTPYTDLRQGESFTRSRPVDIGLGIGYTYINTCGVAYPNRSFRRAGFGFSNCDTRTDLHELGHVIGLAHGPNNSSNPASGYIFPDFGHGDYDQCKGGRTDDIMAYGDKSHFFNSTMTCSERFGFDWDTGDAGDRNRADSAYHWNRIRYDLSLIHDEHNKKDPAEARSRGLAVDDDRPLIID